MIDLNSFLSIGFIVVVIIWRCGPKRSELWRAIKLWAEDNEEAALVRETRRELRQAIKQIRPPATVIDNGREYVIEKGAA